MEFVFINSHYQITLMQKYIRSPFIILLLIAAVIALFVYTFFFNSSKIVYVDSGRLLSGYKAMVQAKAAFEKKQAAWNANVDSLTNDVQEAIKKYEKTTAMGTDKEKQMAKEFITSKQKDLYNYQNAIKQNAGQEEQKLTQGLFATVNAYLVRYGKKHGYKLILIASNGNIGYADESIDITDKIIEDLNNEYSPAVVK
jgi:outer membrane protein